MGEKTKRLRLILPYEDDYYDVGEFNQNYKKLDEELLRTPVLSECKTLEEFAAIVDNGSFFKGDTVVINQLLYILTGEDPQDVNSYIACNPEAMVIMKNHVPASERIKGSIYFQVTKARRLLIKIFRKFYSMSPPAGAAADTMYFVKKLDQTQNKPDGNMYRFTCKNLIFTENTGAAGRTEGNLYLLKTEGR